MKRKVTYTCDGCGCKIQRHKVEWKDGKPYCNPCKRYIEKNGTSFSSTNEWMRIYEKEQKRLNKD